MEGQVIYRLEVRAGDKIDSILKSKLEEVVAKLHKKFGGEYELTSDDFDEADEDWSHEIKIRKGNKIGVEVDLKWEKSNPNLLSLEVDEGSKLGNRILYGCLIGFSILCAVMASNDIPPLAFLPGSYKLATGLGGVIGLIPGGILGFGLKSYFLKDEKAANEALLAAVLEELQNGE